jgi:translation initiation factor 2 alpha subunit (eIF-2alpha)
MSYYGNNYPEIDEVVFVTIKSFTENGIYCTLVEYDGKEGFLSNTELDKKIYYERKKYFNYIKVYPMMVIDINFDKEFIDLSHKRIKSDERDKYIKYFDYVSKIYKLTEEFSKVSKLSVTDLLPLTMWNFMKKDEIENSQKKFKAILQKPDGFVEKAKEIYPSESSDFLDSLSSRISSTILTIHQQFELIVYCENAIQEIKNILDFPELESHIKIEYINSPIYRLVVECKFDDERNDLIDKYIEIHKIKVNNNERSHSDLIKLGNDIFVDDIDKYIELIKERIKGKNIYFEIGDKLLIKEREITIKYLPKDEFISKKKEKNKNKCEKNEEEQENESDDY